MDKIVFDSYAWIEYFRGSEEGEKVDEFIKSKIEIITPTIVIAELSDKYRRLDKEEEWKERRKFISLRSKIVPLTSETADKAGKIKKVKREEFNDFLLADGMILAIAELEEALVLTGDPHMVGPKIRDLRILDQEASQ